MGKRQPKRKWWWEQNQHRFTEVTKADIEAAELKKIKVVHIQPELESVEPKLQILFSSDSEQMMRKGEAVDGILRYASSHDRERELINRGVIPRSISVLAQCQCSQDSLTILRIFNLIAHLTHVEQGAEQLTAEQCQIIIEKFVALGGSSNKLVAESFCIIANNMLDAPGPWFYTEDLERLLYRYLLQSCASTESTIQDLAIKPLLEESRLKFPEVRKLITEEMDAIVPALISRHYRLAFVAQVVTMVTRVAHLDQPDNLGPVRDVLHKHLNQITPILESQWRSRILRDEEQREALVLLKALQTGLPVISTYILKRAESPPQPKPQESIKDQPQADTNQIIDVRPEEEKELSLLESLPTETLYHISCGKEYVKMGGLSKTLATRLLPNIKDTTANNDFQLARWIRHWSVELTHDRRLFYSTLPSGCAHGIA